VGEEEAVARQEDEQAEERPEERAAQEEAIRRLQTEIERLTVADHLILMMQSLSALAVNRLGLTEETAGRKDPEQARLAIDAFKALLEVVERTRPAEEMKAHRAVLAQLQMTYVAALGPTSAGEDESLEEVAPEGGS
jgi:hypothetical protein